MSGPERALLGAVDDEVAALLRRLPPAWLDELGPEDAFMLGPAVAAALVEEAARLDADGPGAAGAGMWDTLLARCVRGTPFADIRMEAMAGPVCAVQSARAPGIQWFSWLALSRLVGRPDAAPLVVVLHDVDRRGLPLRDALGWWAEAAACSVLVPELPVDPRRPGGDTAYAGDDVARAAEDVRATVDELAAHLRVDVSEVLLLAVGHGCALLPHLAASDLPVTGAVLVGPLPGLVDDGAALRGVPLRLVAGSQDVRRAVDGPDPSSGLQQAREALRELRAAGLDARLDVVGGSGGEVLDQRVEAVPRPARPTLLLQAATRHLDALLGAGSGG